MTNIFLGGSWMRPLQQTIINELHVKPAINPKEEIRRSVDFLKAYLKKHDFLKTFVLGISGGQDSTLAGRLAQLAMIEMREETGDQSYQFMAVRLPYGRQSDSEDAEKSLAFIAPDKTLVVDIKPAVEATVNSLKHELSITDFNKGNIKARQRMIVQFAIAGDMKGAVIGTDHAAENVTGFFTKFGDGAADILPLARLNKRQGRQLLQELGAQPALYEKVPTADLEEDRPLLADEEALGVSYEAIDDYLEGKEVSDDAAAVIESWYRKTQHKRHLPITVYDEFWK